MRRKYDGDPASGDKEGQRKSVGGVGSREVDFGGTEKSSTCMTSSADDFQPL